MSSVEKIVAAALLAVLVVLVGAYFVTGRTGSPAAGPDALQLAAAGAGGGATACAPTGGGAEGVPTQEFGEQGANLEIVAALPITHGCHVETEAELKKAYEQHPDEIHLVIYDLFGKEGQEFVAQHGGQRALVFINGESSFELNGRRVKLEVREGGTYVPADIVPIVEHELAKAS